MIIQLHTPDGIIERDTDDMTQEELEALGYPNLRRIEELLAIDHSAMNVPDLTELVFLLAEQLGYGG